MSIFGHLIPLDAGWNVRKNAKDPRLKLKSWVFACKGGRLKAGPGVFACKEGRLKAGPGVFACKEGRLKAGPGVFVCKEGRLKVGRRAAAHKTPRLKVGTPSLTPHGRRPGAAMRERGFQTALAGVPLRSFGFRPRAFITDCRERSNLAARRQVRADLSPRDQAPAGSRACLRSSASSRMDTSPPGWRKADFASRHGRHLLRKALSPPNTSPGADGWHAHRPPPRRQAPPRGERLHDFKDGYSSAHQAGVADHRTERRWSPAAGPFFGPGSSRHRCHSRAKRCGGARAGRRGSARSAARLPVQ
jgi:hypothetical protein